MTWNYPRVGFRFGYPKPDATGNVDVPKYDVPGKPVSIRDRFYAALLRFVMANRNPRKLAFILAERDPMYAEDLLCTLEISLGEIWGWYPAQPGLPSEPGSGTD